MRLVEVDGLATVQIDGGDNVIVINTTGGTVLWNDDNGDVFAELKQGDNIKVLTGFSVYIKRVGDTPVKANLTVTG